jgi:hypothetical protein
VKAMAARADTTSMAARGASARNRMKGSIPVAGRPAIRRGSARATGGRWAATPAKDRDSEATAEAAE